MKRKLLCSIFALVGMYGAAMAQGTTSNSSHNVTLNLSNQLEIVFTKGGPGITMTFANPDDYTNGVIASNVASLQVRSNRSYTVAVKSAAANFTSASATTMPVNNVLFVKEATAASYLNLSTTDQTLIASQARGTNVFDVSYKATPGFNYDSGTYTVSVTYTATQL